jgi:biopolymer transport protein TolR
VEFHRRRRIEAAIDMTPMIDTLLQLFLIFLLSASFVASSVRLNLPRATAGQSAPRDTVVVSVSADHRLFLNNEPVGPAEFLPRLRALLAKRPRREVILRADKALPYRQVLRSLVEIRQAGAETVHLAYDEDRGP